MEKIKLETADKKEAKKIKHILENSYGCTVERMSASTDSRKPIELYATCKNGTSDKVLENIEEPKLNKIKPDKFSIKGVEWNIQKKRKII